MGRRTHLTRAERWLARAILAGLVLWWLFAIVAEVAGQEALTVRFLDVGQGDAVLVSHEGASLLYDTGPYQTPYAVQARLRELGVDTLALLVTSHPHADHIGGSAAVLDSVVVLAYAEPGTRGESATDGELRAALERNNPSMLTPANASVGKLGSASLTWLPPPADSTHWSLNDRSLGLRVCLAEACLQLAGDAEHAAWRYWLQTGQVEPVTVHKSSHHGSRNGDTRGAWDVLNPDLVVISTGKDNRYGHPHSNAIRLYSGARVLRTDIHGETVVELRSDGTWRVWVEDWEKLPIRWWGWPTSGWGPM